MPDFHSFVASPSTFVDKANRTRIACAICGKPSNAWSHRSAAAMAASVAKIRSTKASKPNPEAVAWHELPPKLPPGPKPALEARPLESIRPKAPSPRIADWRLTLLRLAIEQALNADLSMVLRMRLTEAQRALRSDLYGTVAIALPESSHSDAKPELPKAPSPTAPDTLPAARPSPPEVSLSKGRVDGARQAARAFRGDKQRALFLRAVDAGWDWAATGSGHMRIVGPTGAVVIISTTAIADRGHGYRNLKSQAKRAGLDVEGL